MSQHVHVDNNGAGAPLWAAAFIIQEMRKQEQRRLYYENNPGAWQAEQDAIAAQRAEREQHRALCKANNRAFLRWVTGLGFGSKANWEAFQATSRALRPGKVAASAPAPAYSGPSLAELRAEHLAEQRRKMYNK